jgi:anaerobic selenocysteine-containing dehydrogenase
MMRDLQRAYDDPLESETNGFSHKLISRRLKDRFNGCWREHPVNTRHWQYNPAFMHPDDLSSLGLAEGDLVEIRSRRGAIKGVAMAETNLLSGVVSMSHSWGANPDENADPLVVGANTGLLTDSTVDCDPYSAMPRMSSIPVNINLIERRSI